jgi:hypothetical protein
MSALDTSDSVRTKVSGQADTPKGVCVRCPGQLSGTGEDEGTGVFRRLFRGWLFRDRLLANARELWA